MSIEVLVPGEFKLDEFTPSELGDSVLEVWSSVVFWLYFLILDGNVLPIDVFDVCKEDEESILFDDGDIKQLFVSMAMQSMFGLLTLTSSKLDVVDVSSHE